MGYFSLDQSPTPEIKSPTKGIQQTITKSDQISDYFDKTNGQNCLNDKLTKLPKKNEEIDAKQNNVRGLDN